MKLLDNQQKKQKQKKKHLNQRQLTGENTSNMPPCRLVQVFAVQTHELYHMNRNMEKHVRRKGTKRLAETMLRLCTVALMH